MARRKREEIFEEFFQSLEYLIEAILSRLLLKPRSYFYIVWFKLRAQLLKA